MAEYGLATFAATLLGAIAAGAGGAWVLYRGLGQKTESETNIQAARIAKLVIDTQQAICRAEARITRDGTQRT